MERLSCVISSAAVVAMAVFLVCSIPYCGCIELSGPGTDRALEDIFKGRCEDYLTGRVNPLVDLMELKSKNCSLLWELFFNAFAYREPCDVTMDKYDELIQEARLSVPMDMALYWDAFDVYDIQKSYVDGGKRACTLESMLIGYIMNGLVFCGQRDQPGLKYDSCPDSNECGFAIGSMDGFWAAASKYFGTNGRGNVRFIFNSNRPGGAFHVDNSYFTTFELEYMNASSVTHADIYIITFLLEETRDTCESLSVQTLMTMLTAKDIKYKCTDQPDDVLHVLCADDPTAEECAFAHASRSRGISRHNLSCVVHVVLVNLLIHILQAKAI